MVLHDKRQCGFRLEHQVGTGTCRQIYSERILQGMPSELVPGRINQDGITAHLYYDENEKKLDLQCISCHLDAGHYNPDYKHGKLTGIPGAATATVDTSLYFKTATPVTSFTDYTEQIPGTAVAFKMVAIPGGTFKMGSTDKEPFHKADEAPVRNVTVSPFFMAEVEVTWDQYWAFYGQTMSEDVLLPEPDIAK